MELDNLGKKLILPDLLIPRRRNKNLQYSGMDSIEHCLDKKHFETYPYHIDYCYNDRGFRDRQWPSSYDELKDSIWCLGDSFTVGIGQPFEHIWPTVLSQVTNMRAVNISMDGASNDWIYRRALDIMRAVAPTHMVVMWSYTHRRESRLAHLSDDKRIIHATSCSNEQDYAHWVGLSNRLHLADPRVTQITIPDFHNTPLEESAEDLWQAIKGESWPHCPKTLSDLVTLPEFVLDEIRTVHRCHAELTRLLEEKSTVTPNLLAHVTHIPQRLDWARDYHHFDILTSQWVVDRILHQIVS